MSNSSTSIVVAENANVLLVRIASRDLHYKNSKKFVADIPKLFKNVVKGVIFNVFDYQPTGYKTNMDFCEAIKEKLDSIQINYHFEVMYKSAASALLIAAKINVEFHEVVYVIVTHRNDNDVLVTGYEYTEIGYKNIVEEKISIDPKENPKVIRDKILGSANPKKIILSSGDNKGINEMMKSLRVALKSKKLIVFEKYVNMEGSYIEEVSKWFLDKSYTKYYILPKCIRHYFIAAFQEKNCIPLLSAHIKEPLPFKKTYYLNASSDMIVYGNRNDKTSCQTFPLKEKCHQYKINVNIDINNFLDVSYEALTFKEIKNLPKHISNCDMKIPVIGIIYELSVICVQKNDKYEFSNPWNGSYVKELIINFEEEKPKYFDPAYLPGKQGCLVYDLMKIMALPCEEVRNNEKWSFTISENDENPVLLEFDNYDETKKAASPAFLMALLFKQHLKAIKKKTGEKPTRIGICLLQKFTDEERKRVEKHIHETCELLKIHCVFVNV